MQEMEETQVQTLGLKDPLEKEMATNSSILAWRISWTEEPGRPCVHEIAKELDITTRKRRVKKLA